MKKNNVYALLIILSLMGSLLVSCQTDAETTSPGDVVSESQPTDVTSESAPVDFTSESPPAEGVISDSQDGRVYEVGDVVSVGNTILVVLGWDIYPGGLQFPPEEGYEHIAVDVMLANQGKDPFELSPGHVMTVKDSAGEIYYMNSMSGYVSGSVSPDGEIVPGEIMRGKVGFQVPESQAELMLLFEPDERDLEEISINLGSTPVSFTPPTDLNLKLQQTIYQIGDSAEILDQVIQVIEVTYPADDEIIKPEEGYKSLVVDVQVENQGDSTLYFIGSDQIYLKDSTGQKYSDDSLALPSDSDHVAGSLEPGESIRGKIGFLVPDDAGGFIFVFDSDQFEFGKVFISLD